MSANLDVDCASRWLDLDNVGARGFIVERQVEWTAASPNNWRGSVRRRGAIFAANLQRCGNLTGLPPGTKSCEWLSCFSHTVSQRIVVNAFGDSQIHVNLNLFFLPFVYEPKFKCDSQTAIRKSWTFLKFKIQSTKGWISSWKSPTVEQWPFFNDSSLKCCSHAAQGALCTAVRENSQQLENVNVGCWLRSRSHYIWGQSNHLSSSGSSSSANWCRNIWPSYWSCNGAMIEHCFL